MTLAEQTSRYTVPIALLASRRDATTTCDTLITMGDRLPSALLKALTCGPGQ